MLDIVQLPLARRLWKISKLFQIPLNDPRMQELDIYDLEFYELSQIADDPKKLSQLKNHFYDSEFDKWMEEFELEQAEKGESNSQETVEFSDDYDISEPINDDDWEEVN